MCLDPWPCLVGQGSVVAMSCGVGRRHGLDLALLWLWCRPAATAPIRPLAWELPCAVGGALKCKKKKKKKKSPTLNDPQNELRSFETGSQRWEVTPVPTSLGWSHSDASA